jgi:hypothetical protein
MALVILSRSAFNAITIVSMFKLVLWWSSSPTQDSRQPKVYHWAIQIREHWWPATHILERRLKLRVTALEPCHRVCRFPNQVRRMARLVDFKVAGYEATLWCQLATCVRAGRSFEPTHVRSVSPRNQSAAD